MSFRRDLVNWDYIKKWEYIDKIMKDSRHFWLRRHDFDMSYPGHDTSSIGNFKLPISANGFRVFSFSLLKFITWFIYKAFWFLCRKERLKDMRNPETDLLIDVKVVKWKTLDLGEVKERSVPAKLLFFLCLTSQPQLKRCFALVASRWRQVSPDRLARAQSMARISFSTQFVVCTLVIKEK